MPCMRVPYGKFSLTEDMREASLLLNTKDWKVSAYLVNGGIAL
ncbi:hypothetical protein SAMN05518855_1003172 [Paenibacillus sp. CF384]|nr:hypothetical protein SAMN05518855_1003172 [Paenibacillus sp. CF384]